MTTGLTDDDIEILHRSLVRHVERGEVPGLVALVARGRDVHVEAIGHKAFGDSEPIDRDAIFRIASVTKPIAGVAAMLLVQEGAMALDEPIGQWLPELANPRVLRSLGSELDDTVPADRPITVEDVLSFRLGFGSIMVPGTYPVQRVEAQLGLKTLGPPWPYPDLTADEWLAGLSSLPLLGQPGTTWRYNTGASVAGILIERVAGAPIGDVLRERVFEPLGMADTGFFVPPGKLGRFTTFYRPDQETGELQVFDEPPGWWSRPPKMADAASGLVSTVDDLWAFASMMAAGGGGLLAPESLRAMTRRPDDRPGASRQHDFGGRSQRLGPYDVGPCRRRAHRCPGRFWLGWRHRDELAHRYKGRRHRDPPHPADGDLPCTPAAHHRFLGRCLRGHLGPRLTGWRAKLASQRAPCLVIGGAGIGRSVCAVGDVFTQRPERLRHTTGAEPLVVPGEGVLERGVLPSEHPRLRARGGERTVRVYDGVRNRKVVVVAATTWGASHDGGDGRDVLQAAASGRNRERRPITLRARTRIIALYWDEGGGELGARKRVRPGLTVGSALVIRAVVIADVFPERTGPACRPLCGCGLKVPAEGVAKGGFVTGPHAGLRTGGAKRTVGMDGRLGDPKQVVVAARTGDTANHGGGHRDVPDTATSGSDQERAPVTLGAGADVRPGYGD